MPRTGADASDMPGADGPRPGFEFEAQSTPAPEPPSEPPRLRYTPTVSSGPAPWGEDVRPDDIWGDAVQDGWPEDQLAGSPGYEFGTGRSGSGLAGPGVRPRRGSPRGAPPYPPARDRRGAGPAPGDFRPRSGPGARRTGRGGDDADWDGRGGARAGVFAAVGERFAGRGSSRDARSFRPEPPGPGEQTTMQRLFAEMRSALQLRGWVLKVGIPIIAMIPVGIIVVIFAGANSGGGNAPTPTATGLGFPPANLAAAAFTTTPGQQGRGLSQTIAQVASNGNETVAVGTQTGANVARARFFVSQDAGRTWRLGTETGPGKANPPPGHAPAFVAGGAKGWVAVGPDSVWTSPDGVNWTLQSATGPAAQAGDRINVLTRTANGFLAAGQNTANGTTTPVVWISANGTAWQRIGAGQLGLKGATAIRFAAAGQNGIIIAGAVAGGGDGVWRSANGGTAWTQVTVPVAGGAQNTIAGIAQIGRGFVAVRPAVINGSNQAIAYTSQTGTAWTQSAQITTADNAPLTLGPVTGGQSGAVVTGEARGVLIGFFSADGVNWVGSDPFGTAAKETFTGVALTTGNVGVMTATQTGNARRTPVITLIGGHGQANNINVNAIPGAVQHELAVNAVAAAGGTQVAAGSADGFPALWASADGGTTWKRGTGAALNRAGVQRVTGVAHGSAGWVAVGGVTGATRAHPVVVTSADGATWTQADDEPAFAVGGLAATGVAAGHGGYAIVGTQTAGPQTAAVAWFSAGPTGWQQVTPAGGAGTAMSAVASTTGGFVAVGSKGAAPAAWLSQNGRSWALRTLPLPKGAARAVLTFVAANGNRIAAVGTATAMGQVMPFADTSTDGGKTWTESALPVPSGTATVTAVAASGAGFTATGAFGTSPGNQNVVIWTLMPGGTAWTPSLLKGRGLNARGIQEITALTASGNALIGIGFQATATAEEPIIWQAPIRA